RAAVGTPHLLDGQLGRRVEVRAAALAVFDAAAAGHPAVAQRRCAHAERRDGTKTGDYDPPPHDKRLATRSITSPTVLTFWTSCDVTSTLYSSSTTCASSTRSSESTSSSSSVASVRTALGSAPNCSSAVKIVVWIWSLVAVIGAVICGCSFWL